MSHGWTTHVVGGCWHAHTIGARGAVRRLAACGRRAPHPVDFVAVFTGTPRCLGCVRALFGPDDAARARALDVHLGARRGPRTPGP